MKNTKNYFKELTIAVLDEKGYDVDDSSGYIVATHSDPDVEDLLIFPTSRCLSDKKAKESTMVKASEKAVDKLIQKANELPGNFFPALSFAVGHYSLLSSEIIIADIAKWASNDSEAFFKNNGYFYFDSKYLDSSDSNSLILYARSEVTII